MMKPITFGIGKSVFRQNALFVSVITKVRLMLRITSGKWVIPVLVVLVRRFSTIMAIIFGVGLRDLLKRMVTVILKSGTSCSCNLTAMLTAPWKNCQNRLWIPAWAWSESVRYCNTLTPTMILIFLKP